MDEKGIRQKDMIIEHYYFFGGVTNEFNFKKEKNNFIWHFRNFDVFCPHHHPIGGKKPKILKRKGKKD